MSYKKGVLESGWYHVTVRDVRFHKGGLRMTFTIDRGEHAYRNVIEMFSLTEHGMDRLSSLFLGINFATVIDYDSELFLSQFTNDKIRAKAKIDRQIKDNVVKNRVIELKPPTKPEDYNVLKPKTDEFYQKRNAGKELPIRNSNSRGTNKEFK